MNISLLLEIGIFRKVSCSTHDFLRGCSPSRKSPIGSFPQHFQAARFSASSCFDLEVKYASTGTKSGWCKKFFKIPLSNGEEKHVVFIIAMNTTRNKISKYSPLVFSVKKVFKKIREIRRKTPVPEHLQNISGDCF